MACKVGYELESYSQNQSRSFQVILFLISGYLNCFPTETINSFQKKVAIIKHIFVYPFMVGSSLAVISKVIP